MSNASNAPDQARDLYLRTTFLERIAHELRGPAGVASGALDEIESALGTRATEVSGFLAMARRGVQRILRVARRLHRTAQLESGGVEWVFGPTDLRVIVEQGAREAERLEARRGIRVQLATPSDLCWADVDAAWLAEAVSELVANAIRFARTEVMVEVQAEPEEIRVVIGDDGPGVRTLPSSRFGPSDARRGLGLSVPMVLDVLRAHGGRLEFGPQPSGGGRVLVALKRVQRGGSDDTTVP